MSFQLASLLLQQAWSFFLTASALGDLDQLRGLPVSTINTNNYSNTDNNSAAFSLDTYADKALCYGAGLDSGRTDVSTAQAGEEQLFRVLR
jgi:hypothetical protein